MKNKAFSKLSAEEKETKILGALDRKTEGLLLPKELLAIANAVPQKQQYTIRLYQSNTEYWRVLSLDRHPHHPDPDPGTPAGCRRGHHPKQGRSQGITSAPYLCAACADTERTYRL